MANKQLCLVLLVLAVCVLSLHVNGVASQPAAIFCQEGQTRSCGSDVGACQKGVTECIGNVWSDDCKGSVDPIDEICDNGIDDDCNGLADDCGDTTMTMMSYMMIGIGAGLLVFAVVLSKIQSRRMENEGEGEEKSLDDDQG